MIKMGIIGFGFMGHEHANMLATLPEIELTAVCDIVPEQLDDASGMTAEIEPETYYLTPKRAWFIGGATGSAVIDGAFRAQGNTEGQIVRTRHLLKSVPGRLTMTSAGPTRSFGEPEPGEHSVRVTMRHRVPYTGYFGQYLTLLSDVTETCAAR